MAAAIVAAAVRYDLRVSIEQTGALRENELAALSLSRSRLYDGLLLSRVGMGSADAEWLNVDYPVVILGELIIGARWTTSPCPRSTRRRRPRAI
ncbi:hypothetical protein ACIRP7_36755 [Streptomyces sp. NPDC102270]|uniref:hypothetical protein n=1 Tax=Streptomyces sp. NPDC102270 TaxID=3366150 RepID=UPI0037FD6BB5